VVPVDIVQPAFISRKARLLLDYSIEPNKLRL
jgi:hypothetical protein